MWASCWLRAGAAPGSPASLLLNLPARLHSRTLHDSCLSTGNLLGSGIEPKHSLLLGLTAAFSRSEEALFVPDIWKSLLPLFMSRYLVGCLTYFGSVTKCGLNEWLTPLALALALVSERTHLACTPCGFVLKHMQGTVVILLSSDRQFAFPSEKYFWLLVWVVCFRSGCNHSCLHFAPILCILAPASFTSTFTASINIFDLPLDLLPGTSILNISWIPTPFNIQTLSVWPPVSSARRHAVPLMNFKNRILQHHKNSCRFPLDFSQHGDLQISYDTTIHCHVRGKTGTTGKLRIISTNWVGLMEVDYENKLTRICQSFTSQSRMSRMARDVWTSVTKLNKRCFFF